jgi:hypothetical protein
MACAHAFAGHVCRHWSLNLLKGRENTLGREEFEVVEGEGGEGLMTEAVTLLSAFALDQLAANCVEISCDVRNERSRAVAERCGFVLEGRLRNAVPDADGNPVDTFVFSCVPADDGAASTGN